ncbi:hypothetical protein MBLNU13_g08002t1 [Cladosporium sp. NU13]
MAPENNKILLTGATGFIDGSILSHLLKSQEPAISNVQISCLLRGADRAESLTYAYDTIAAVAAQHDIFINATFPVKGLAKRQAVTGNGVWIIHTSGVSNIGDKPITKPGIPVRIFDDLADDIYNHQRALEDSTFFIKAALHRKKASVTGNGEGVHGRVHIADLVELYNLVLLDILDSNSERLPSGRKGIIFSSHGEHSKVREAKLVAAAGHELGLLPDQTVEHLSLGAGVREMLPHIGLFTPEQIEVIGPQIIDGVLAFNARTISNVSYSMGWKPLKAEDVWERAIMDDMKHTAVDLGLLQGLKIGDGAVPLSL